MDAFAKTHEAWASGDYAAARVWLLRSMRLHGDDNVIADSYWDIVQNKLTDNASGKAPLLPGF